MKAKRLPPPGKNREQQDERGLRRATGAAQAFEVFQFEG